MNLRSVLFQIICWSCLITSCDLIEYHPYDVHINGDRDINAGNIALIEKNCEGKDTIRFAFMGDTQRWYDETEKFVTHINKRDDIDFVIHGGDIADFGLTREFEWMRDILGKLKIPYVALIGNHDILGNGMDVFEKIYGEINFSFRAGSNRFICLNTSALEFDYSHPVPDFNFMYEQLQQSDSTWSRTIPVMHVPPGDVEFNNNVSYLFQEVLKYFPGMEFCLHAHTHALSENDFFKDGIIYYGCESINKHTYLLFTLTPEKYEYEVVAF